MNSLWILLACGVACAYAHPTCDYSEMKKCEAMMPSFDRGDMFPSDPAVLQKRCGEVIPAFDCYIDLAEACPALVPPMYKEYFISGEKYLHKVCDAGDYQTTYLKHAKCLNDIMTTKQDVCNKRAEKEFPPNTCPYYKSIEKCLYTFVENTCGDEAEHLFDDFFSVIKATFENGACDKH